MAKLALFPVLLVAGCVISGIYGAVHDQLSYTVSPDYFHHYKFHQFRVPPHLQNRAGAALVGWYATWWMGLLIGLPLLTVGLILPGGRAYLTRSLVAYGVVALTALLVALGGLVHACRTVRTPDDVWWRTPPGVTDVVAFGRVGVMHDFSYLGGFIGILTGSAYLVVARVRMGRRNGAAVSRRADEGERDQARDLR